jgi:hypothetical protein
MAEYRYMAACMHQLYIQGQMGRSPSRATEAMMSRVREMMQKTKKNRAMIRAP